MKRRNYLKSITAAAGVAGVSGIASGADCSGVPEWDETTLYSGSDRVRHPDSDGVSALWEVAIDSRNAEPSRASAYWDYVGDCGGDGGTSNEAPTASFTTDVSTPAPGDNVSFDASGSSDSDGSIASYSWAFGDGTSSTGQTASHSYDSTGDYTVTLTVTDDDGATGSASTTVSVSSESSNAAPNASFTVSPSSPTTGDSVTFDAADSSDSDGSISSYEWDFGDGSTATGQSVTNTYSSASDYTATLTVTDDDGASDSNSATVTVQSSNDGGSSGDCSVAAWDASVAYSGGDQAAYNGYIWEANWWTKGDEPGAGGEYGPWSQVGQCDTSGGDGGDDGGDGGTTELSANLSVSSQFPDADESVEFDASDSTAPGSIESYEWDFGDGSTGTGQTVTHSFARGQYDVVLTITDDQGDTATDTIQITAGRPQLEEQRVVAYWRQWAQYDRDYTPDMIPYDNVTHVQYAFLRPEKDGALEFLHANGGQDLYGSRYMHNGDAGTFYDGEIEDWRSVGDEAFSAQAAQRDDTKFVASVGGWGDSEYFSPVAQDPDKRKKFAQDCVELVESYNLDGVDIDWEYPGGGGCTSASPVCDIDNISQEGDQQKFTLLMQEVRDALDKAAEEDPDRDEPYELTAAVVADPEKAKGLEHEKLSQFVDFVSVMTFDYRGIWSGHTAHHSPLKHNPDNPEPDADTWNASSALAWWEDQGWDPEQLNMAVPFYGRSWSDVQAPDGSGNGTDDGLFQKFEGEGEDASGDGSYPSFGDGGTNLGGIWEYYDLGGDGRQSSNPIDLSSSDWETYFDEDAIASWSYNKSTGLMISHPTERSIREKMNWLSQSSYGGTMLWAIGADTKEGDLISTLWTALNG